MLKRVKKNSNPGGKVGGGGGLSPGEIATRLVACRLTGVLDGGGVWLAVSEDVAILLNAYVVGIQEGGEATAKQTRDALGSSGADVCRVSVLLTLVEAAHYMIDWGALRIWERSKAIELSNEDFWTYCISTLPSFVPLYAAYRHFRTKSWFLRSGIIYGADFVLYERHPSEIHADYCVVVVPSSQQNEYKWKDIQAMHRLCNQISKGLMLLYVEEGPHPIPLKARNSIAVEERVIKRWDFESAKRK
ncbi:hypothetical protein BSKO_13013 [Bryopsis sp. KO-2023]|nr:hypothetical protein BSKO_13013 [Bryopsis sp. KO-2023]